MAIQNLFIGLVLLIFLTITVSSTLHGKYTVGNFVMIIGYVTQLTTPLTFIAGSLIGIRKNVESLVTGLKYIDIPIETPNFDNGEILSPDYPIFELHNVTISNKSGSKTIEDANLKIEPGRLYVISGPSGAGKTTLMNALIGLIPLDAGRILYRGVDLSKVPPDKLMQEIAVVPQHPFIFTGTIRDNVTYGTSTQIEDNALIQILSDFGLGTLLKKDISDPLESFVGHQGRELSGGERQRITICRALLRRPKVLVLDEPTSSLDAAREAEVLEIARNWVDTIIVISHRDTIISSADVTITLTDTGSVIVREFAH